MSSVATPPWHPAPSISNTSVMYGMYRVGARERGFAIRVVRYVLVHVRFNVRERLAIGA